MDNTDSIRDKLTGAARALATLKRPLLDSLKANYADLERDDFLWHYLLQSFATLGGVSGWDGLIANEENYHQMTYDALSQLPAADRLSHATEICNVAKVRYASRKGQSIVGCFDRIAGIGGPVKAKECLLKQQGRDGKIAFLKGFPGIGNKYARNIMMDVYHEDFRDSIAIDIRIQAISTKWGLEFQSYEDHELFYLDIAHAADLNGWELDRLMFRFQDVFSPPLAFGD